MLHFLHAADIHLDSPLRGLEIYDDAPVEQIRTAARRAFDNLVSLAVEEEVDFVLLAGDLYDGDWKDYNTGLYFVNRMGRLREKNIPVFLVSGNHDAASQITKALTLPPNVHHFSHRRPESVILEELGVAVHGQSFSGRNVSENLARSYPQPVSGLFNIGLLHTSLTGRAGHEPYAPCRLEELVHKGYAYWALGHVHQREIVHTDPWVVFPGNIQGRHIRETGPKGCTLVRVDGGAISRVEHRDLDVLRFTLCRVDISGCATLEAVWEEVRASLDRERRTAEGRSVAARLVLTGKTVLHAALHARIDRASEEIGAIAADWGDVWLEKVELDTSSPGAGDTAPVLPGLFEAIESVRFDADSLSTLTPEFEALRAKLPAELLARDDPFHPDAEQLERLNRDVRNMLMARLQGDQHEN